MENCVVVIPIYNITQHKYYEELFFACYYPEILSLSEGKLSHKTPNLQKSGLLICPLHYLKANHEWCENILGNLADKRNLMTTNLNLIFIWDLSTDFGYKVSLKMVGTQFKSELHILLIQPIPSSGYGSQVFSTKF